MQNNEYEKTTFTYAVQVDGEGEFITFLKQKENERCTFLRQYKATEKRWGKIRDAIVSAGHMETTMFPTHYDEVTDDITYQWLWKQEGAE